MIRCRVTFSRIWFPIPILSPKYFRNRDAHSERILTGPQHRKCPLVCRRHFSNSRNPHAFCSATFPLLNGRVRLIPRLLTPNPIVSLSYSPVLLFLQGLEREGEKELFLGKKFRAREISGMIYIAISLPLFQLKYHEIFLQILLRIDL